MQQPMVRLEPRAHLYEDAYDAIRRYIVEQRLKPGDPLPSERQIHEQLGISRAPVREALRVLQNVGLIEARQGKGLFVKELDLRPLADAFAFHLSLVDRDSFGHLFELRQMLELGAAEAAALKRTDDDLTAMAAVVEAMRERLRNHEPVAEEDLRFHELIVRAAHNPLVEHLYASMAPFLANLRVMAPGDDLLVEDVADHVAIFNAIERRDVAGTVRSMHEHMMAVRIQHSEETVR
jgi:GntR family transcriptional repressor for pyruvate dehydrogenase complex